MENSIKLNNNYNIPILGLGTWLSQPGEIQVAIENAVEIGYRHIDCAWAYRNENEIGEGLLNVFQAGKVKREDMFITSKLWNSFHRPEMVHKGLEDSLNDLKLDYLDLYLVHWPVATKPGNLFPDASKYKDEMDEVDLLDTWKAMEKLVDSGKVRSIGLSNFNIKQVQYILDNCRIKPAVNQIEVHIYLPNKKLIEFCLKNDVQITAYCPLGGTPTRPGSVPGELRPMENPQVLELAKKYNATPAQILINYIIHRGLTCVPKSVSRARMEENMRALDIKLSEEDFQVLHNFNVNARLLDPKLLHHHETFPFVED